MAVLDPNHTTVQDLCSEALRECGAIGVGQQPLSDDFNKAWTRLQWMLQQWQRKRWLVPWVRNLGVTSTGALTYSIGPGGAIDTGASSARPAKIESAFLRQLTQTQPNQIDYPLEILQAREDYDKVALKQLQSFPGYVYYEPNWPLGQIYCWPVPQPTIYGVFVSVLSNLPQSFPTAATGVSLPFEYFGAVLYCLALRLRSAYQLPSFPGDPLPGLAKDALNVIRGANAAIARLTVPTDLTRNRQYNIFSDRNY